MSRQRARLPHPTVINPWPIFSPVRGFSAPFRAQFSSKGTHFRALVLCDSLEKLGDREIVL
jgi:hypothetical protein